MAPRGERFDDRELQREHTQLLKDVAALMEWKERQLDQHKENRRWMQTIMAGILLLLVTKVLEWGHVIAR